MGMIRILLNDKWRKATSLVNALDVAFYSVHLYSNKHTDLMQKTIAVFCECPIHLKLKRHKKEYKEKVIA